MLLLPVRFCLFVWLGIYFLAGNGSNGIDIDAWSQLQFVWGN